MKNITDIEPIKVLDQGRTSITDVALKVNEIIKYLGERLPKEEVPTSIPNSAPAAIRNLTTNKEENYD